MPQEEPARPDRSKPLPVKHWSFAGLAITHWCNARCDCCYMCCSPARRGRMTTDFALSVWRQLIEASPGGCRVHITGGEPFGDYDSLIALCRRAASEGLGPPEKVETNAFWADDEKLVASRLRELDLAGMGKFAISCDPYHQQFVPIERCCLAARVARDVLGPARVQVRWEDWLAEGEDTAGMPSQQRRELFLRYAGRGRERLNGRAARELAAEMPCKSAEFFADRTCREGLLRSRHVHVDADGRIIPGVCAGIVLGVIGPVPAGEVWRQLADDWSRREVVGRLEESGPYGLLKMAEGIGYVRRGGYASGCHMCWDVRRWLLTAGKCTAELGPDWVYSDA